MNLDAICSEIRDCTAQDIQAARIAADNVEIWKLIEKNQKVIDKRVADITTLQDELEAAEKRLFESLGEEKRLLLSLGTIPH